MGFVLHPLTYQIIQAPEKAASAMLSAYRKAKCKAKLASEDVGITEQTWIRWVKRLDAALRDAPKGTMSARLAALKDEAVRKGWHHKDLGGRPLGKAKKGKAA